MNTFRIMIVFVSNKDHNFPTVLNRQLNKIKWRLGYLLYLFHYWMNQEFLN